jgi:hypothetical protein
MMGSNSNTRGCILEPQLTTHQFLILPYVHTSIYHAVIHHSYLTRDRLTRAIQESGGGTERQQLFRLSVVTITSQAAWLLCKPYSCIPEICSVLTIPEWPEWKDQTILQDNIRQPTVDVAIAQSQRSATKLPTVLLHDFTSIHKSQIVQAVTCHPSCNILLQDDGYLNALQSGVSVWRMDCSVSKINCPAQINNQPFRKLRIKFSIFCPKSDPLAITDWNDWFNCYRPQH